MRNYKVKSYIKKQLIYSALQTIEAKPFYIGRELKIQDLTYEEVKGVMKELTKPTTWQTIQNIFETCFRINSKQFYNGRITEFFEARNFILETFNNLIKVENALLRSIESLDAILWEQAGGQKLNRHGATLPLNQLGKIYSIYPFDLRHKKYQEILLLLTIEKEQREVQTKYNELKSKVKTK